VSAHDVRILLVDDHRLVRTALREILAAEPDLLVIGEAGSAAEALDLLGPTRPDVVLMDVHLPNVDGIAATRAVHEQRPQVRVLMLSATCTIHQVRRAVAAGACGYLVKDMAVDALCDAVRAAVDGTCSLVLAPEAQALVDLGLAQEPTWTW
jgi:DNA-binding NarL/FixJ family response regulator